MCLVRKLSTFLRNVGQRGDLASALEKVTCTFLSCIKKLASESNLCVQKHIFLATGSSIPCDVLKNAFFVVKCCT